MRFRYSSFIRAAVGGIFLTVANAHAHEIFQSGEDLPGSDAGVGAAARPPLYQGLGELTMRITTASSDAQAYFDQGLRLAWAFNHGEARRSFMEAQRLDLNCAMCLWGEAFVLGPNINDGMHEDAVAPAFIAVSNAAALKDKVTPKERALIEALSQRYAQDPEADRNTLNQAWADAMRQVAKDYPEDVDVLVLLADALMNLQPWDYWEAGGKKPKGVGGEIVTALEQALELDPNNTAAAHLYIHALEASADPGRAEKVADALRGTAPAAGHLVHMPSHIYARVGRHGDSIQVNRDAIVADEKFLQRAGSAASSLYRFGYYPHNVHYLMVSAQMAGVRDDAISSAEKLASITSDKVSVELAWVQAIKTAPYSAHAQFSETRVILALAEPDNRFPFVKGFWRYARAVAFAHSADINAAELEVAEIGRLIDETDMSSLEAQYLPARDILSLAKNVAEARIRWRQGNLAAAEQHLRKAVALQDGLPYMEPPYWYYPVRQTLGAVILQQNRAAEAAEMFKQALQDAPRNGWTLWGLLQAQIGTGDADAPGTEAAFKTAWLGDSAFLRLDRL